MNYTNHLQLPQWAEQDRIMMEDFNDAMTKLDAKAAAQDAAITAEVNTRAAADSALSAKAGAQLIASQTLLADANEFELSLASVDWRKWSTVIICIKPAFPSGDYRIRLLGDDIYENFNNYTRSDEAIFVLYPCYDPTMRLVGFTTPRSEFLNSTGRIGGLSRVLCSVSNGTPPLSAGTTGKAWGLP